MDLHNKYRPKKLADVIGQKHVVATLKKSSLTNKFAHSYIFSGQRGTGKTSMARILSALLNDETSEGDLKDSDSKISRAIFSKSMPDVIELDGAENRKVEDVEHLIEMSHYAPSMAKQKIYIIDECHQLSSTAISALLKIVEEPPSYLTFIFCTTEFNKIPETIVSRSQCYKFYKLKDEEILTRLKYISSVEGISIEDGALKYIANLSSGSLRDSIGKLQQISTAAGEVTIKEGHVSKYFGSANENSVLMLFDKIMSGDLTGALLDINELYVSNCDIEHVLGNLSEIFREFMLYTVDNDAFAKDPLYSEIFLKYNKSFNINKFPIICKIFSKINMDLEYNINKRWVMESFVIECIGAIQKE